jgi:hypothetical protein
MFPNPSSIVVKLSHPLNSKVVKELKFPKSSDIVVNLSQPPPPHIKGCQRTQVPQSLQYRCQALTVTTLASSPLLTWSFFRLSKGYEC